MTINPTKIPGCFLIQNFSHVDNRGTFVKIYQEDFLSEYNLKIAFKEVFYSYSKKNVIRGMHFQSPPFDCEKLIYVPSGEITDVVLDLRKGSPMYKKYEFFKVSHHMKNSILVPKGCAHGFLSISDTIVTYLQSETYQKMHDLGIRWDSFEMDWGVHSPIISERDSHFPKLKDYKSPFNYSEK